MAGTGKTGVKDSVATKAGGGNDRRLILDFLLELREHNDRTWFEANRGRYEQARGAFEALVGELIANFEGVDDLGGVTVKECVFRINRDVRFSGDKSPYKTAMGAVIGRGGRKSGVRSYYLHIEPEGRSMLAGGFHSPTPAELGKVRRALAENPRHFRKILEAPDFARYFGELAGETLKTAPQGYAKDHPAIDLLRMKQFLAVHPLTDALVASKRLLPEALTVYKAMKPFVVYLESTQG
jgi:uncharacterized protein (TIGR02453 family)